MPQGEPIVVQAAGKPLSLEECELAFFFGQTFLAKAVGLAALCPPY